MIAVAITGGICDGKSVILSFLNEFGAETFSSDQAARDLLHLGTEAWQEAQLYFPEETVLEKGEWDRSRLAKKIASNDDARQTLNRILHPRILSTIRTKREEACSNGKEIFAVEIPLLIEIAGQAEYDRIIVAKAGEKLQLQRINERMRQTNVDHSYLLHTQMRTEWKCAFADFIVNTNQPIEDVKAEVHSIWTLLWHSRCVVKKASCS